MQTPNTKEGELTELIMARIKSKIPDLPNHIYNPIYSSVLEVLESQVPTSDNFGVSRKDFLRSLG